MFKDAHDAAPVVYEPNGTFNAFNPQGFTASRLDHIFVSPQVEVLKYGILTDTYRTPVEGETGQKEAFAPEEIELTKYKARTPSDHFPVKISVEI